VLYPKVTNVAFEGFPCFWFEPVGDAPMRGWLRADVSIECNTPEHNKVKLLSWAAVTVYPVGMWFFTLALLRKASTAILSGKPTPFSRSVAFLYKGYKVPVFWWELMEMMRKFLLIGLFVTLEPGTILQIAIGTIVSAAYIMMQLKAQPYKNFTDDVLAQAASWCLLMLFFCCVIYKYDSLTASDDLQRKMSLEQRENFIVPDLVLSMLLLHSVWSSLLVAGGLVLVQIVVDVRNDATLRRLKYVETGMWAECKRLSDPQAYHLFLSHAWPAAQDRMRTVKTRLRECLPSCRTYLDVEDLKSGSGMVELDKSGCILVFCTLPYFEKRMSLKELFRAVCQCKHILAMLEPDIMQQGGLNQVDVQALITNAKLDMMQLRKTYNDWSEGCQLLADAFEHPPDEDDVRTALFKTPPIEWNRLPHLQDVTIRLIAQRGVLRSKARTSTTQTLGRLFGSCSASLAAHVGSRRHASAHVGTSSELYLENEMAFEKVILPPPLSGRRYHLFCSTWNAGALALAEELSESNVFVTEGKKASATLYFTTDVDELAQCDHMLVLLDERTWTSGADTAKFVRHIHMALRIGVHIFCVHEFPAVVGPHRHACDFAQMFNDDWTPAHLTGGPANVYKEIDLTLKGEEWRQPGLVALATKVATSAGERKPIKVQISTSYEPKRRANPWAGNGQQPAQSNTLPKSAASASTVPYSRGSSAPSQAEVELVSMPTVIPVQPTSTDDLGLCSTKPLPRPRMYPVRRRSEDTVDEMREFGSRGSREHPPTRRRSSLLTRVQQKVKPRTHEPHDPSGGGLEGRVCGGSAADDTSASCLESSLALDSSQPERRASVVGRARADSLADDPAPCWVAKRSSSSAPGASTPEAARESEVTVLFA